MRLVVCWEDYKFGETKLKWNKTHNVCLGYKFDKFNNKIVKN